jgi:hypothetical protein
MTSDVSGDNHWQRIRSSPADVILWSGSTDTQFSADAAPRSTMSYAFMDVLCAFSTSHRAILTVWVLTAWKQVGNEYLVPASAA